MFAKMISTAKRGLRRILFGKEIPVTGYGPFAMLVWLGLATLQVLYRFVAVAIIAIGAVTGAIISGAIGALVGATVGVGIVGFLAWKLA